MTVDLDERPYNPGYGWYEATTSVESEMVMVYVAGDGPEDRATLSKRVDDGATWIVEHLDDLRGAASDRLLDDRNADWADDEHPPVDAAGFQAALRLGALRFRRDRTVEITFHAGDLFLGHWVVLQLDADRNVTNAYPE